MPAYNAHLLTNSPCPALGAGIPGGTKLWNADTKAAVVASPFSQQANIPKIQQGRGPTRISVDINFPSDPGAFTIEIQTASADADANFVSESFGGAVPGQITAASLNAGKTAARVALDVVANFVRLRMVAAPANNVAVTGEVNLG